MRHLALLIVLLPAFASAKVMGNLTQIHHLKSATHFITGEPISLPPDPEVQVMTYELPVGASLPVHMHPYPRYAYMLEGDLEVTYVEEKEKKLFHAGDFLPEAPGHWHYGRNVGKVPVKMLVIDHVKPGTRVNTVMKTALPD